MPVACTKKVEGAQRVNGGLPLLTVGDDLNVVDEVTRGLSTELSAKDAQNDRVFWHRWLRSWRGQTLAQFGGWSIPGVGGLQDKGAHRGDQEGSKEGSKRPPMTRFYDNLDPFTLAGGAFPAGPCPHALRRHLEIRRPRPKTLSQALSKRSRLLKTPVLKHESPTYFLASPNHTRMAPRTGCEISSNIIGAPCLEHHTGIGGRFAVLTNVGLLPAISRGADPARILMPVLKPSSISWKRLNHPSDFRAIGRRRTCR